MPCRSGGEENLLHIRVKKVLFLLKRPLYLLKNEKNKFFYLRKGPKYKFFV
ncbi:hypothetical protein B4125_2859 [Bacillus paralicheniformis]|nr:hypothetical protein SC10_B2orf05683 [Bacillus paralicheniformis]OLG04787.1 hypothetical protein B4125_2859 [Bacillus paralicheniformis]TWJ64743.1 hypothetical protein CHCC5021_0826 [Bacillus paralicheniformis]TWK81387.1 hypothetical protein CHCC20331_3860 [Bacillus paralicheniformis]TWL07278.1 hypothetical protein CHCC19468_3545 [Bacillus paralicheniformis]